MDSAQLIRLFWEDPEPALKWLLQEHRKKYHTQREMLDVLVRESGKGYPTRMRRGSLNAWVNWSRPGLDPQQQRAPNLKAGVRLFRLLLSLEAKK